MGVKLQTNDIFIQFLIFLLLTASIPNIVFAKVNKQVIPENARAITYGSGWECKHGYQKKGNTCIAIKMPENAYLTTSSFGDGWDCSWGYRKSGNACIIIFIPKHAFLNSNGYDWQCEREFRLQNKACIAVIIPENAYFIHSTYGEGWECKRGYIENKNTCVTLLIPSNAHIDYSGHDWDCNPPYIKLKKEKCALPASND